MVKKMMKGLIFLIILGLIGLGSYNYYYYYKSLRLNKDIYRELKMVTDNLEKSLVSLNNNDIQGFLNNNYLMIKHSNYLKNKNHKIYNNIFVKINMLDGSPFSNEVSDALLWFNEFNTELNNFYSLNNELFNGDVLYKDSVKTMKDVADIKATILDLNVLLSSNNQQIISMMNDQKINKSYFDKLSEEIQLGYKFFEVIDNVMGAKKATNNLVLFQNSYNLNQSGGKWIYYLTLVCKQYKCETSELDFGSNLSLSMVDKLIPPEEIRTKKSIWVFEDLGWFFDFNDSASLALKYYPTKTQFDNVIGINISIFERLLKSAGTVDFELDDKKITVSDNDVVSFLINLTQYKSNKELASNSEKLSLFWTDCLKALKATYKSNNLKLLIVDLYKYINNKSLQIYAQKNIMQTLKDLNYNNNLVVKTDMDYFALTRSNIMDKSLDGGITQKVNLKVKIDKNDKITDNANVLISNNNSTRITDKSYTYLQFYINKNSGINKTSFPSAMGASKQPTVDYEKHGFVLDKKLDTINTKMAYLASDDVRVYEDREYFSIGGWVISGSNSQKKVEFNWSPKYTIKDNIYKLFVQKQPNVDYILNLEVSYPSNGGENTITKNINIDSDKLIEIKLD